MSTPGTIKLANMSPAALTTDTLIAELARHVRQISETHLATVSP